MQRKTRLIYLFDSAGVDVSDEIKDFTIEAADADGAFLSYAVARAGGVKDYTAKFTIPQDYSAGSLWTTMVSQAGQTWKGYYTTDVADLADLSATAVAAEFDAIVSIPNGVIIGGATTSSTQGVPTVAVEWKLVDFDPADLLTADPTDLPD
jgi:hypothetical protein